MSAGESFQIISQKEAFSHQLSALRKSEKAQGFMQRIMFLQLVLGVCLKSKMMQKFML
jgi:hypothetical protein